jgi:angiogenesis inhibitor 1
MFYFHKVDGHWANWDEWSTCTFTCNTGTRERTRDCIDPQFGGKNCTGAAMQTEFCNTNLCPGKVITLKL